MMYFVNKKRSDIFLTKQQLVYYLINDSDNFYIKLKPIDIALRNVENINEYKQIIQNSADEFTISEMRKLNNAMKNCDRFLQSINKPGFNGLKCKDIPWKIGCIVGNEYEAGMPHTRSEVIIFPRYKLELPERIFTKTLMWVPLIYSSLNVIFVIGLNIFLTSFTIDFS